VRDEWPAKKEVLSGLIPYIYINMGYGSYIYISIYRYGSYPTDMRYKMDINLFKNGAIP